MKVASEALGWSQRSSTIEDGDVRTTAQINQHGRPGTDPSAATREALRSRPRRRPRPRILASGVMEFWSTGVLRIVGIAPRVRGVGSAFRATLLLASPRAEAG
jgi:hypothetical protein